MASWRWRAGGTTQQSAVGTQGLRGCQGTGSHECQVKECGLNFIGGGVSSTECKSRSILSGLNLESSLWRKLADGFEGNKIGDQEYFRGN